MVLVKDDIFRKLEPMRKGAERKEKRQKGAELTI